MKRLLCGFCLLLILAPAIAAWAGDGLYPTALTARAMGMAGVDLAIATDAADVDVNPAGLMQIEGQRIDLGGGILSPIQHFKNDLNDINMQNRIYGDGVAAYGLHPQGSALAFGFGVYGNNGLGATDYQMKNATLGDDTRYYTQFKTMKFVGALAWAPHPRVSLALAPALSLSRFDMDMPYDTTPNWLRGFSDASNWTTWAKTFPRAVAPGFAQGGLGLDEATFRIRAYDANAYGVGGKFGLLVRPIDELRIGFMYELQVNMKYWGHAKLDMGPQFAVADQRLTQVNQSHGYSPQDAAAMAGQTLNYWGVEGHLQSRFDYKMEFSWPEQLGLGLAYQPLQSLLLGADVKWIQWSHTMGGPVRAYLRFGNSWAVYNVLGSDPKNMPIADKWNDQVVAAVGAQYAFVKDFFGRIGYNYASNPVPATRVSPLLPGQIEHHVAAGLGYRYKIFEVNAAYQFGVPETLKGSANDRWGQEYHNCQVTQGSHEASLMASFLF